MLLREHLFFVMPARVDAVCDAQRFAAIDR
jgi:hypothetical protein